MSHEPNGWNSSNTQAHNTPKALPRFCTVQYRTINIKTVSEEAMKAVLKACSEKPNARIAWVKHPAEEGKVPHFHLCASFTSPVRLGEALEALYKADPCNYVKPCRNFRASVRYLAHLDNPEKCQIDPSEIALVGDWDGVALQSLFERRGATADLSQVLSALRNYLPTIGNKRFKPALFALWLDTHGYSSKKAFCMVRQMGLDWAELASALDDLAETPLRCDTPAPSVSVSEGIS